MRELGNLTGGGQENSTKKVSLLGSLGILLHMFYSQAFRSTLNDTLQTCSLQRASPSADIQLCFK